MDGRRRRGTTLEELLAREMKDPEFRRHFEEAEIEYRVSIEIAKAREAAKMTQTDLARAIRTKQQTISRLESGAQNVTIETLQKIAKAVGRQLRIEFVAG